MQLEEAERQSEPAARASGRPRRSQTDLLDASAAVFVEFGVDAPVRAIAAKAKVGIGTIYRHFPTRSELIVAVYRRQIEVCGDAGPRLLAESSSPEVALRAWIEMFVDFLVTKHGLANALHGDAAGSRALHAHLVDRLVPACSALLDAARADRGKETEPPMNGYNLLKGVGNLCIGASSDPNYRAAELVQALITGALDGERFLDGIR